MGKAPLPLNPPPLSPPEDLPPKPEWTRPATPKQTRPITPPWTDPSQVTMERSPSPAMSIYPSFDLPPILPPIDIPWSPHRREHSSMEQFTEPPLIEQPEEDPDSPMKDAPAVVGHYPPEDGPAYVLDSDESPIRPWEEYHKDPSPPVSRKHSRSPTSPSSAPIRQRTTRGGSYHSITPAASSPVASTSSQNPEHQSASSEGSADNPSSTQSSADDVDNAMALNWVTINTDYRKG